MRYKIHYNPQQKKKKKKYKSRTNGKWKVIQNHHSKSGKHSITLLTCLATFPTVARKAWSSNHIFRILSAFSKGSPSFTAFMLISAVPSSSHCLIKWVHMNPFCCRPFLSFDNRASCMKTKSVWDSIWVETKE